MNNRLIPFHKKLILTFFLLTFILSILASCGFLEELDLDRNLEVQLPASGQNMMVHFIDVGQGDSILIQLPNQQNMLIDAGDNHKGQLVVDYLKEQGVSMIDYLIATHPQ